jgi:hypothetical protein
VLAWIDPPALAIDTRGAQRRAVRELAARHASAGDDVEVRVVITLASVEAHLEVP